MQFGGRPRPGGIGERVHNGSPSLGVPNVIAAKPQFHVAIDIRHQIRSLIDYDYQY